MKLWLDGVTWSTGEKELKTHYAHVSRWAYRGHPGGFVSFTQILVAHVQYIKMAVSQGC